MTVQEIPNEKLKGIWIKNSLTEFGLWPIISREQIIGAIVVGRNFRESATLTTDMKAAIMDACAGQMSMTLDLMMTVRIAEEASQKDLLTGLLNRRGLEVRLNNLVQTASQSGKYIVFALVDMDDLKTVNDTQGHPAGDEAITQIASILKENLRSDDLVARFGGDEFAVAIVTEKQDYRLPVLRIQKAVLEQSLGLTVSVGGVLWGIEGKNLEECYQLADRRLYEDKRKGKRIHD